jgi:hypothetical protein
VVVLSLTEQHIGCVMVGFSGPLLGELDKMLPAGSVAVIEEPDLIEAGDVVAKAGKRACFAEVIAGPAQQQGGAPLSLPDRWSSARLVVPGSEYSVVATAAYAQAAGLPGAGVPAALALRDKGRLRAAADAAGLAQPGWAEARSPDDVREPDDDPDQAWERRAGTDEPSLLSRGWTPDRYLVETYLVGPEVSAEVLVSDGDVLFVNVTAKSVFPGRWPVEAGHTVPAPLDPAVRDAVVEANRALVAAVGFLTGALHSEWILVDGVTPHLVECAGRLPGDAIVPLIDLAYGGSMVHSYLEVLGGGRPEVPSVASSGAAVRFIAVPPGTVRAVHGVDEAKAAEGVFWAGATVSPGEVVPPLACSWDRAGHVLAVGADGPEAMARAERAATLIRYDMEVALLHS